MSQRSASSLRPGEIRVADLWRRYRLTRERNATLKETVLRRRRVTGEDFWALRGVSFDVSPGTGLGVIGVNGSGKTTLLKVIAGVLGPSHGTVDVGGSMASLLDLGSGFSPEFTGSENIYLNAALLGIPNKAVDRRLDEIVDFSGLGSFIDQPVRTYSTGMMLRLAFSVAVTVEAEILLLDEVLAVGDEAFQKKCLGKMFERRASDTTIVFVSHDTSAVQLICDQVILLEQGRVVADGKASEVVARYHESLSEAVPTPAQTIEIPAPDAPADAPLGALPETRSWGSGRVRIESVRLRNERGEVTTSFLGSTQLRVEVDYAFDDPGADEPDFAVSVSQLDGDLLFAAHSAFEDAEMEVFRPRGTVVLVVPELPLLQGRFVFSASVSSKHGSEVYHSLERWLEFSVFAPTRGDGPVALRHRWELSPAADPAVATVTVRR